MKKYNITTQKTYQLNGEEKKAYPQVGKLVQFDATEDRPAGFIFEWNSQPDTKFYVFEDKPKEDNVNQKFNEMSQDSSPF